MPQRRYEGFGGKVALHAEMKAAREKRKKAKAAKKKTEEKKPKPVLAVYGGTKQCRFSSPDKKEDFA